MKKLIALITLAIATSIVSHAQVKIGDATLPSTLNFKEQTLNLNGAGIRKKLWFKLYSAGLYLNQQSKDAANIVKNDAATGIRLHITSSLISTGKLIGAVQDGFEKTNTETTVTKLQPKLDKFIAFIDGDIEVDDIYDIIYLPNQGTSISKNGVLKGSIDGLDFKQAIFNIWLAQTPVDEDLKEDLLKKP